MTTEQRKGIRRGILTLGFRRTHVTRDRGDGQYTEIWTHPAGEKIVLRFAPKTKEILTSAKFLGSTLDQVRWGGNDDPVLAGVKPGVLYDVYNIEVHSWHTKLSLVGFEGKKFNSASFALLDESVMDAAVAKWRQDNA